MKGLHTLREGYDLTNKIISEKDIQTAIIEALSYKCIIYNVTTGVFKVAGKPPRYIKTFPKGTPDLIGARKSDGKMFFIEVKNAKGRLSPEQEEFARYISGFPVLYGVARSVADALRIVGE